MLAASLYGILFETARAEFILFISLMMLSFAAYGGLLFLILRKSENGASVSLAAIVWLGIGLRVLAWLALPALSDDYFRFLWDGQLFNHGTNPFLKVPSEYMKDPEAAAQLGLTPALYEGMNSPHYFTIYPPVLQGIFVMATALFPTDIYGGVLIMKLFHPAGECGSLWLLVRLLQQLKLSPQLVAWYALNPMVIVELSGNGHFEGLMICFLLASIYLLWQGKDLVGDGSFCLGCMY